MNDLWKRENKKVPHFITDCIEYLNKHLDMEGIFRINANVSQLKAFVLEVEYGKKPNFNQFSPVIIAGAFKQFFRELPEPLFPSSKFYHFLNIATLEEGNDQIKSLRNIISLLKKSHRAVLSVLIPFLSKVASYSEKNKMVFFISFSIFLKSHLLLFKNTRNLAIIFAPLIVFPRESSVTEAIYKNPSLSDHAREVLELLIDNVEAIFNHTNLTHLKVENRKNTPPKERVINRNKTTLAVKPILQRQLSSGQREILYSPQKFKEKEEKN